MVSAGPTEGPRAMGLRPEAGGSLWRREGFGRARASNYTEDFSMGTPMREPHSVHDPS